MENLNSVISSFNLQKTLQSKIWVDNGKKINPKVRENLLEIAYQFIDSFGLDVVVDDIIIVGSIANYNWSKFSDIDLHILIDYNQFTKKLKPLYIEYFDLKKIVFNQKRDIKMFGYDVEVYVEDSDIKGVSGGVYSILNDEWLSKPKKERMGKPNFTVIVQKSKQWMRIIDGVIENIQNESPNEIKNIVNKYKEKLKKYRLCGLEKDGEMSIENLVFKVLRRNGYIEKLYSIPTKLIDKKLSLDEKLKN
jgi:predicted nucleotidyltransferase